MIINIVISLSLDISSRMCVSSRARIRRMISVRIRRIMIMCRIRSCISLSHNARLMICISSLLIIISNHSISIRTSLGMRIRIVLMYPYSVM